MASDDSQARPMDGSTVELRDSGGHTYSGRVENAALAKDIGADTPSDAGAEHLVVATMLSPDVAVPAQPGDRFELTWTHESTAVALPVTLAEFRPSSQVQVWNLVVAGAPSSQEMRRGTRTAMSEPVELVLAAAEPVMAVGTMIDVSAGGMQCVMPAGPDDVVLTSGTDMTARFVLAGEPFAIPGTMLSVWSDDSAPRVRVTVRFNAAPADGARLEQALAATGTTVNHTTDVNHTRAR